MNKHPHNMRRVDKEIVIDCPVEEVWKMITQVEGLTKWFCPQADIEPGVGGKFAVSWGPGMSGDGIIKIWDPPRQMQYQENVPVVEKERSPLVIDYSLETDKGKTVLRIITSGFTEDTEWDDEFDSISRGWELFMLSLRHYLECHREQKVRHTWHFFPICITREEAWNKLFSRLGDPATGKWCENSHYSLHNTTQGIQLEGLVQVYNPPKDLGITLANYDNSLMRIGFEKFANYSYGQLAFLSYGNPRNDVASLENICVRIFRELFG